MIFFLISLLRDIWGMKIPAVFEYSSTRMILAGVTTLSLTIFLGPWFIRKLYELKIGQSIRTEECPLLGELHKKKQDTPTMGGILMLTSMLFSMFLWMNLTHIFTLILLLATLWLGGIGACDDYLKLKYRNSKGMSMRMKLLLQLLFVALLAFYFLYPPFTEFVGWGSWFTAPIVKDLATKSDLTTQAYMGRLFFPFFKDPIILFTGLGLPLFGIFMFFVVSGSSNAVNLTDGLDGLAAGCLVMTSSALAVVAFLSNNAQIARYLQILYIEGSGEIAVYLSALSGACLGFLWYNGSPAQVFMGDTGSLCLGGIIGVAALLLKREFFLALVGGVFVSEALSVMLQVASFRLRNKKRIFLCSPLHHHFEYKGWPEMKVVMRFWIVALLLAAIGLASLKFQ